MSCKAAQTPYDRICWEGDWRELPTHCPGQPEVWDQTIGCPVCGMNIWYLPAFGQWPEWDKANEPPADWWQGWKGTERNPYDPYVNLFDRIHPFAWADCHDPGDEDRDEEPWNQGP